MIGMLLCLPAGAFEVSFVEAGLGVATVNTQNPAVRLGLGVEALPWLDVALSATGLLGTDIELSSWRPTQPNNAGDLGVAATVQARAHASVSSWVFSLFAGVGGGYAHFVDAPNETYNAMEGFSPVVEAGGGVGYRFSQLRLGLEGSLFDYLTLHQTYESTLHFSPTDGAHLGWMVLLTGRFDFTH